ncbi:hypothetical protein BSKO_08274 [Bryopsis sp. KO-2023]|nr:hypothetical protein BSKO_08274 [Bryopsis sp. KO-2023]
MSGAARLAGYVRGHRRSVHEFLRDVALGSSSSFHPPSVLRQWSSHTPRERRARRVKVEHQAVISLWRDLVAKKESGELDADVFRDELSIATSETIGRCKSGYVPFAETLSVLHTCARLRYQPPSFISFLAAELESGSLPDWSPNQIAKCIYSLGALKALASARTKHSYVDGAPATFLFEKAIVHVVERTGLENINAFGLANIVYSVGKWGPSFARKHPDVCRALSYECVQRDRLEAFTAQGLSNIIYSMGLLGISEQNILLPLVTEASLNHRLEEFTEQHLSNIVYGLGLSRFNHHTKLFKLLGWTMDPNILKNFTAQGLCNFLTGLSRMDFRDAKRYMPLVHEAAKEHQLERMTGFQIASLVQSCGGLGIQHEGLSNQLAKFASQPSALAEMQPRSLANVICGLAKLHVEDRTVWEAVFNEIRNKSATHKHCAEELGAVCWGMAASGFYDASTLDRVLSNLPKLKMVESKLLLKTVSQALYACWRYGHIQDDFLEFAWDCFKSGKSPQLTDWDWIDMAWSLCLLERLTLTKFQHICKMLQTAPSMDPPHLDSIASKFDERVRRLEAHIRCYHVQNSRTVLSQLGFKKRRRDQLERFEAGSRKTFATSPVRSDVQEMLLRTGHTYDSSVWVEEFCHVDLSVNGLLLLVPERKDYFTDIGTGVITLANPVSNKVKLLEGLGHKVCCVDIIQWENLNAQDREAYLLTLLGSKT